MGKETTISWADSTNNPTMGCDGCELWNEKTGVKNCYAGILHDRYGGSNKGFSSKFNILTKYPGRMAEAAKWNSLLGMDRPNKPWLNGMPRVNFISDMSDALSKAIDFQYLYDEIICNVSSILGRRHIWMWLTKLPSRMVMFDEWLMAKEIPWPSNLWAGTSVTAQPTMKRVEYLMKLRAPTQFLSIEPLLEEVRIPEEFLSNSTKRNVRRGIIAGGESGDGARFCDIRWLRSIAHQCNAWGFESQFYKQLGSYSVWDGCGIVADNPKCKYHEENFGGKIMFRLELKDSKGENMAEFPADLQVRKLPWVKPVVAR